MGVLEQCAIRESNQRRHKKQNKIECKTYDIFFLQNISSNQFPKNMNLSIILACLFLIGQFVQIHSQNSMDRPFLRARNQYLRLYVLHKKDKIKSCWLVASTTIKDSTNRIYNKVLSTYYDAHASYYSLSQEDRDLIEQIINLHF